MRSVLLVLVVLVMSGCSADEAKPATTTSSGSTTTTSGDDDRAPAPTVPQGPLAPEVAAAVERVLADIYTDDWDLEAIGDLADFGDARVGWLLADLMRFYQSGAPDIELVWAFSQLTGAPQDGSRVSFVWATNNLIAWDLPAWEGYADAKRRVFSPIEDDWAMFYEDDHGVDWRLVTWGGVLADTRPLDDNGPCSCIPALDHPETTDADRGDWYDDDRIVFGVVVDEEAIALPKHQMEVHEMVNLTLGGRELGIPYCTLCGSAQAYYVDNVPGVDRVVLRTSGLLQRSNKLMYDLTTGSAIDTFTGKALTGPLGREGVVLEQVSVVAATWGDWKRAHPSTLFLAEDGGIGRAYRDDPLGDRDAAGPIFPVGDVDARLPAQERVVGVIAPDGTPVAFPVDAVTRAAEVANVTFEGLTVRLEDGIRVYDADGREITSHHSFWFAWSQFHRGTLLWAEERQ